MARELVPPEGPHVRFQWPDVGAARGTPRTPITNLRKQHRGRVDLLVIARHRVCEGTSLRRDSGYACARTQEYLAIPRVGPNRMGIVVNGGKACVVTHEQAAELSGRRHGVGGGADSVKAGQIARIGDAHVHIAGGFVASVLAVVVGDRDFSRGGEGRPLKPLVRRGLG